MNVHTEQFFLGRDRMLPFLDTLRKEAGAGAVTFYLPTGTPVKEAENLLQITGGAPVPEEVVAEAAASKTGAAAFISGQGGHLVLPPFPLKEKTVHQGFEDHTLRLLLETDFTIGLVLVHLGSFAVGVCRGEKLLSSKVGTGLVHGRTRKGGSSSARFARRRANQADEFLDRVCRHAREHLEPRLKELDYLVYGGPQQTVRQLQKLCPFLGALDDRVLPLREVPELRQRVLETTIGRLWSSRVIEWGQDLVQPMV